MFDIELEMTERVCKDAKRNVRINWKMPKGYLKDAWEKLDAWKMLERILKDAWKMLKKCSKDAWKMLET